MKQNIVLIGMPGSGKTTVGRILADRTGRPLRDSDDGVIAKAGQEITQIFAEQGEETFRAIESEVIREIASVGGQIIATGGGVPIRPVNVEVLKQNGVLYFLDRPLEALLPTDDRPLANDVEKIRKRYEERYDIYTAAADHRIPGTTTPEEEAEQILTICGLHTERGIER